MQNPALLILNLRRQASRARRLAEGVRSDIQARLLTYADEFDSQAQALEAEADLSSAGEAASHSLQR